MKRMYRDVLRLAKGGVFLVVVVALCWRAVNYSTLNPSLLAPLLCVALAIMLLITGVAVVFRGGDFDQAPEQMPAQQFD